MEMIEMARRQYEEAAYPGVFRLVNSHDSKTHRVHSRFMNPKTGKEVAIEQLITADSDEAAFAQLIQLKAERLQLIRGMSPSAHTSQNVRDCASAWLALKAPNVDPATVERYEEALAHVGETLILSDGRRYNLGDVITQRLERDDVQLWVNTQRARRTDDGEQRYSRDTVHGWFRVLRTLVHARPKMFDGDPCAGVEFGATTVVARVEPTLDQERRFYASLESVDLGAFVYTHLKDVTAQRGAHVAPLKWSDIDRATMMVTFARKYYRGRIGLVSAHKPAPPTPITQYTLDLLDRWRSACLKEQRANPGGWVFPGVGRGRRAGYDGPRSTSDFARAWAEVRDEIGIDASWVPHRSRGRWYDFSRDGGVDPSVAQSVVGHASAAVADKHYKTIRMDERRKAVEMVEQKIMDRRKEGA